LLDDWKIYKDPTWHIKKQMKSILNNIAGGGGADEDVV